MKPRRSRRVAVQLPVTLRDASLQGQGTVVNISIDGCAALTKPILAVGSYYSLDIELPQEGAALEIELAAVRWQAGDRCGMEFIRVREERKAELQAFVRLLENP